MSEEKMSISISNSTVSGQLGQAGRDLIQNQQKVEKSLTVADVIAQLAQISALIQSSSLPDTQKNSALRHVEIAVEEVQRKEPEKSFAAKNLQRVAEILKNANESVGAGQGIFEKVKPIFEKVLPWFGVAKGFLGF